MIVIWSFLVILTKITTVTSITHGIDSFSYLTSIFAKRGSEVARCFGTKISHNTILAPAHCLVGFKLQNIKACSVDEDRCPHFPIEPCFTPTQVFIFNSYLSTLSIGRLCPDLAILVFPNTTFSDHDVLPINFDPECHCSHYNNEPAQAVVCDGDTLKFVDVTLGFTRTSNPFGGNFTTCNLYSIKASEEIGNGCLGQSGSPVLYDGKLQSFRSFCIDKCIGADVGGYPCLIYYQQEIENYRDHFYSLDLVNEVISFKKVEDLLYDQAFLISVGVYGSLFRDEPLRRRPGTERNKKCLD